LSGGVTVNREYLQATRAARTELVLLHGWGCNREVWRSILAALRPWANVTLLDLPGLAPGMEQKSLDLDGLLNAILASSPERAVYMGWSLGGQLALELAACHPTRVEALVTLCTSPCFPGKHAWPGMDPASLAAFSQVFADDPGAGLRRFDSLQVADSANPRPLIRALKMMRSGQTDGPLDVGLDWLASLDQRASLLELSLPSLHLLGASDGLLAADLQDALERLIEPSQSALVETVPGAGHLAPLEQADFIAARMFHFLQDAKLLAANNLDPEPMAKADVAESFSRAAEQYDSVAGLQRDVGTALLSRLEGVAEQPARLVDLGSGTGYFYPELARRFPDADYVGVDLAEGMALYARERYPSAEHWLVADAEMLPLASGSVDLIFSSLALQWCPHPELLFSELVRVLRPGGRCVFTSLGPDTLKELRSSWAAVDQHQHVNSFLPRQRLQQAVSGNHEISLQLDEQIYRMEYDKVGELLHELKTLGAHNVNRDRPAGLTSRRVLQGMMQAYEEWRVEGVLPATYQVYFGVLEKR
jgi:malonyl-CoA O-methyltransferase